MVKKAKEYVINGDVIQVVLSNRWTKDIDVSSFDIYRTLRTINPSPYMFYLKFDNLVLVGSSPEVLVRKEGNIVETRPIAGTRPRGETEEKDICYEKELINSEKENAEHIMLVDLARNDIGKISKYGSVNLPEFKIIEKFSHVMHIVSSVKGVLKEEIECVDVLKACFPAGTVSGAPKVRAMQIISELEKTTRGPYAGAVGYFGLNGNMDMAITIRTIVCKNKKIYIQTGAGIVADSQPEKEYQETINKAKALILAIKNAETN
jgi:anthranilate synthase component 1